MSEQETRYEIERFWTGTTLVIALHGEIDLVAAPAGCDFLEGTDLMPDSDVVVDLRGVTFIDASGLEALWHLYKRLRGHEYGLTIVVTAPFTRRLLEITGLAGLVPLREHRLAA